MARKFKVYASKGSIQASYVTYDEIDKYTKGLIDKTKDASIKDEYKKGTFSIIPINDGRFYDIESRGCPDDIRKLIIKEMGRIYPDCKYYGQILEKKPTRSDMDKVTSSEQIMAADDKPNPREDEMNELLDNVSDDFDYVIAGIERLGREGLYDDAINLLNTLSDTLNSAIGIIGNDFESGEEV